MSPVQFTPQQEEAPASATPVTPSQSGEAGALNQTQTTPPVIQLDQIEAAVEKAMSKFGREQQRQRDMQESRIAKRLETLASTFQDVTGNAPTEAQTAKLAARAQAEVLQETQSPPSLETSAPGQAAAAPNTASNPPPATTTQSAPDPLTAIAWQIMSAQDIDIEPGDPEEKLIDWSNAATVAESTVQAVKAKQARTGRGGLPLGARRPGGNNPISNINDPYELLKGAFGK